MTNPLENTLGPHQFGTYQQAPAQQAYAYERIEDIWGEDDIEQDSDDSDDDDDQDNPDNEDEALPNNKEGEDNGMENDSDDDEDQNKPDNEDETGDNRLQPKRNHAHVGDTRTNDGTQPDSTSDNTNLRQSKRTRRLPQKLKDNTYQHATRLLPPTKAQRTHALKQRIRTSRDKMVIIQHQPTGMQTRKWFVAQVRMKSSEEEADTENGIYTLRFFIRHAKDSATRAQRSCRYWPEVRYLRHDGTMGPIAMVRPAKADGMLRDNARKYVALEEEIDLDQHLLVGPFDFANPREYDNQAHRIPDDCWIDLMHRATDRGINTNDVNQILPLTATK